VWVRIPSELLNGKHEEKTNNSRLPFQKSLVFILVKYKIKKEELVKIINESLSIAEVCRRLNIRVAGGNYKTINDKIKKWQINISHFTGQGWNVGERFKNFHKGYKLEDVLIKNSPYLSTNNLKHRLYREGVKEKKCEDCNIKQWNNKEIIFELDHIDGDNSNNCINNLKILCPNCHSQTPTFRGKKRKQ
jgi:hypothetical protein